MPLDQVDVDKLEQQEAEMSFLEHLETLRWHIVRAGLAILIVALGVFAAKNFVFGTVVLGPTQQDFFTFNAFCNLGDWLGLGDRFCIEMPDFRWVTPTFGEQFIVHIKVSIIIGFILSFPYVFYEIWKFIKPGLYEAEQKAARGVVFIISSLFGVGILFGYFVIAPFAVTFLLGYELPGVESAPSLDSYISYLTLFTLPAGLIFELPVLVYFLARVGLVTSDMMAGYRKHAVVVLLFLAAMITPPDPITQLLLGLPLYGLYEVSIIIAKRVERRQAAEEAKDLARLN
jgi:sec-independent protein translocase protein TatC